MRGEMNTTQNPYSEKLLRIANFLFALYYWLLKNTIGLFDKQVADHKIKTYLVGIICHPQSLLLHGEPSQWSIHTIFVLRNAFRSFHSPPSNTLAL